RPFLRKWREIGPRDTGASALSTVQGPVRAVRYGPGRVRSPAGMDDLISEADLARARTDDAFRRQLFTQSLERLLAALNRMRATAPESPEAARQLREGADLAVELADRLQADGHR